MLNGSAAQGLALAGASVSARCANGSGLAVTNAVGAYDLRIPGATLPCVLRVETADGTRFHAVLPAAAGTGPFRANLTPLTEWQAATASGASPAVLFDNFAAARVPGAAAYDTGLAQLRAALRGTVDLTGLDPTTAPLVAATSSSPGDRHDQLIDTAMAAVTAARVTPPAVAAALVANPGVPQPVGTLLQPAAATCATLRSGSYHVVAASQDPSLQVRRLTLDARTSAVTLAGNATSWVGADCGYYLDSGVSNDTVFATVGGILVSSGRLRSPAGAISWIGVPDQALAMTEWGGSWNAINWELLGSVIAPVAAGSHGDITIDPAGRFTAAAYCFGLAPCTAIPTSALPTLRANAAGGFNVVLGTTTIGRAFLYRSPAGERVGLMVSTGGDITVMTSRPATGGLPLAGSSNVRQLVLGGDRSLTFSDYRSTTAVLDASTRQFSRLRSLDDWLERLTADSPRLGLATRASGACSVGGAPRACDDLVELPLGSTGITLGLVSRPAAASTHALSIMVARPATP